MTKLKATEGEKNAFESGLFSGALVGGFIVGLSCLLIYDYKFIQIPKHEEMQQGYVQPSKLEVQLSDLDNDGKKEFMLKYEGKSYLMTYENGKPQIREYEVKIPTKPSVEIKLK